MAYGFGDLFQHFDNKLNTILGIVQDIQKKQEVFIMDMTQAVKDLQANETTLTDAVASILKAVQDGMAEIQALVAEIAADPANAAAVESASQDIGTKAQALKDGAAALEAALPPPAPPAP